MQAIQKWVYLLHEGTVHRFLGEKAANSAKGMYHGGVILKATNPIVRKAKKTNSLVFHPKLPAVTKPSKGPELLT